MQAKRSMESKERWEDEDVGKEKAKAKERDRIRKMWGRDWERREKLDKIKSMFVLLQTGRQIIPPCMVVIKGTLQMDHKLMYCI